MTYRLCLQLHVNIGNGKEVILRRIHELPFVPFIDLTVEGYSIEDLEWKDSWFVATASVLGFDNTIEEAMARFQGDGFHLYRG